MTLASRIGLIVLLLVAPAFAAPVATRPATTRIATTKPTSSHGVETVIRHGKIVDGTGNSWFYGDVLIRDGVIAAVGTIRPRPGSREIDATGLVVAPGFIDVHTHADTDLYQLPLAENFIRDGVTSIVTGNCGGSPRGIGAYLNRLEERGVAINVATFIGHNTLLRELKGDVATALTPAQLEQGKEFVRQAMCEGAVGMSTGLIYTPGMYSPPEEIIALQSAAAEFGGIYASHMRSEGTNILSAIDEALRVGREAHCRVEISHFKLPADVASTIGGANTTLGKVLAARATGQEVWLDQYPYTASSTSINTMLPDWVFEKGRTAANDTLRDPKQVDRIVAEMLKSNRARKRTDLSYAVIASSRSYPSFAGLSVKQIAQVFKVKGTSTQPSSGSITKSSELLGEHPPKMPDVSMDEQCRAVIEIAAHGGASCVFHTMDETEVEAILRSPLVSVASDSGVRSFGVGVPHPRGYGTNTRVLGRYVRERHVITLEDAVRKMTSQPALAFRFKNRGLIREGYAADLTIFDADKVADQATFEQPHQYPVGIHCVLVNGWVVFSDGEMTGVLPGSALRGPGWVPGMRPSTHREEEEKPPAGV